MSTPTVSFPTSFVQKFQAPEFKPDRWLWIIPTITAIAIGVIFVPNFSIGLAVGAVDLIVVAVGTVLLEHAGIIDEAEEEEDSPYEENLLYCALFAPVAEEAVFRGAIQPSLTGVVQALAPAAKASFLAAGLNVATTVSIVITSALFGAAHLLIDHKNARKQAISAGLGGIVNGVLAAKLGIGASIAEHIAFNSLWSVLSSIDSTDDSIPSTAATPPP